MSKTKAENRTPYKIEFYNDGVALTAPAVGNTTGKGGGVRSKVGGWSISSRRRMREYMLTHKIPADYFGFSCTFTIPGPPLPPEKIKKLKHCWDVKFRRAGIIAIWRAEIQKRGAMHYHMIAGLPAGKSPSPGVGVRLIKETWLKSLSGIGPVKWWVVDCSVGTEPENKEGLSVVTSVFSKGINSYLYCTMEKPVSEWGTYRYWSGKNVSGEKNIPTDLRQWIGAEKYCADVKAFPAHSGAWKRYLQDHTTKAKQDQIGADIGRHWGVVGRKVFEVVDPVEEIKFTPHQYAQFLRQYQRLCTPYIKCSTALFRKRKGFVSKRGRIGRSVYFSRPETVKRLADWASDLRPYIKSSARASTVKSYPPNR